MGQAGGRRTRSARPGEPAGGDGRVSSTRSAGGRHPVGAGVGFGTDVVVGAVVEVDPVDGTRICWPSRSRAARLIASGLAVASAPPAGSMASITRLSPGRVTTPGR